jgi:hypothetical protein
MVYLFVVLGGAALAVAAVSLRRVSLAQLRVPPWAALGLAAAALGLGIGSVVLLDPALFPPRRVEFSERPAPPALLVQVLPPGAEAPPLEATGWLNGPPPGPGGKRPRLIVLDIWAHW